MNIDKLTSLLGHIVTQVGSDAVKTTSDTSDFATNLEKLKDSVVNSNIAPQKTSDIELELNHLLSNIIDLLTTKKINKEKALTLLAVVNKKVVQLSEKLDAADVSGVTCAIASIVKLSSQLSFGLNKNTTEVRESNYTSNTSIDVEDVMPVETPRTNLDVFVPKNAQEQNDIVQNVSTTSVCLRDVIKNVLECSKKTAEKIEHNKKYDLKISNKFKKLEIEQQQVNGSELKEALEAVYVDLISKLSDLEDDLADAEQCFEDSQKTLQKELDANSDKKQLIETLRKEVKQNAVEFDRLDTDIIVTQSLSDRLNIILANFVDDTVIIEELQNSIETFLQDIGKTLSDLIQIQLDEESYLNDTETVSLKTVDNNNNNNQGDIYANTDESSIATDIEEFEYRLLEGGRDVSDAEVRKDIENRIETLKKLIEVLKKEYQDTLNSTDLSVPTHNKKPKIELGSVQSETGNHQKGLNDLTMAIQERTAKLHEVNGTIEREVCESFAIHGLEAINQNTRIDEVSNKIGKTYKIQDNTAKILKLLTSDDMLKKKI